MSKTYIDLELTKRILNGWIELYETDGDKETADNFRECIDLVDEISFCASIEVVYDKDDVGIGLKFRCKEGERFASELQLKENHPPVIHAHVVVNWLGDCHCSNCGEYCDSAKPFCASCGARFDEPEMREN